MPHALIIEDDPNSLRALTRIAQKDGFSTDEAADLAQARACLKKAVPDIVLVDVNLPDGLGLDLLPELPEFAPGRAVPVVVMTGNATLETAIESLRLGVWDYLAKPVDVMRLRNLLARVPRPGDLHAEVETLRRTLRDMGRFGDMIGRSAAMQKVYDHIGRVAPTEANVFISGESGTGKEVAARTVHQLSRRAKGPFVALNCGAIAANLIESALFGHERGAFTGATHAHAGLFEQAAGGTLFLDEITEMPADQQVKLLRILETRSFHRVGGKDALDADFRLISATNREPEHAVRDNVLRLDLYHRLNTFPVMLPPLRARGEDIALLAQRFLDVLNETERTSKRFSAAALAKLSTHAWPGNVRELRNIVQRAYILADDVIEAIEFDAAGAARQAYDPEQAAPANAALIPAGTPLADAERQLIEAAMVAADGVRTRAASMLGISVKTLYNKLKSFDMDQRE
ncbi:sigma-54-dependent transcriptional regulator [Burkholderia alba]|uniref:sigma-54-dependent transcriptional regulator n=1 Tax=Burkholderia alba TaxID=2683677 RepID=UPI002B055BDC|nr:sigma-54 dependent transcriptional regulator [Burkholderia alba]